MSGQIRIEKRLRLEQKLLKTVIPLIVTALAVVSTLMYVVAKHTIRNRASEYMEQYLVQLSTSVDNKLETSIRMNAQISVNGQLAQILQDYHMSNTGTKLEARENVENILITFMSIYNDIQGIHIFDNNGNEFYLRNSLGLDKKALEQQLWYQQTLEREGAHVIFLGEQESPKERTIGISRSIMDIYEKKSRGVVLLQISYGVLADTLKSGSRTELQQGAVFIQDETGALIYATQDYDRYEGCQHWIPDDEEPKPIVFSQNGTELILTAHKSEHTGWTYSYVCEMQYLMHELKEIRLVVLLLALAVSLITICILVIFARRTFRPLSALVQAMHKVKNGDYKVQVHIRSGDELQYLGQTFNEMASSICELIQKVYSAQLEQRDAQLKVLQQQINPHFLYNTFETMRGIALCENNEKLADMIKSISEFMRYNMYGSDSSSTVETELRHIRNYISIMDYRFDHKFQLQIAVPEAMMTMEIPKFSLQPLVENAVLHGFKQKQFDCQIAIHGRLEADTAVLEIKDNGHGIDRETLEHIQSILSESTQTEGQTAGHGSIGIVNVNARLRLNYGDRFGVYLHSRLGDGTTACIRFPVSGEINLFQNGETEAVLCES